MTDQQNLAIRRATADDIGFIMTVERQPGYAERVGAYDAEAHAKKLGTTGCRYYIAVFGDKPVGFAVLRQNDDGMGVVNLNRIAVHPEDRGIGTEFVRCIAGEVFADLDNDRLWLDVLPSNLSARHLYSKVGFVEEGLMRSALRYPDGRRMDLILMSLLRTDWEAAPIERQHDAA
ncbi:GNAT family N-acetyltransferase [Martelella soudanensis]|uniref:GNAT family N-acetyltransferase n=1 Tax=unclassified Martelella TaxID=2629616 RepID=UPI0015DD9A66|nr:MULTISPECIES: GNAT family N-acetyltransferase [unclassified Martelella]